MPCGAATRPCACRPTGAAYLRPIRFLTELARTDVAPATRRGYGYDLRHFLAWHASVQNGGFALERLGEYDLIAYRQHLLAAGRRPATINRRLDAVRRLCRWARDAGTLRDRG